MKFELHHQFQSTIHCCCEFPSLSLVLKRLTKTLFHGLTKRPYYTIFGLQICIAAATLHIAAATPPQTLKAVQSKTEA